MAALKIAPDQWDAYLVEACGDDDALRGRVRNLLDAHRDAGSFLQPQADLTFATIDEPITERPGAVIGPYKLLEQIGEGGFGVVFMAEQHQPVRRKVALKVLKPGMDTGQVVVRFEAERHALALMDHPNIARVHDGGETATGRPYFVMELVQGVPITKYSDEHQLSPRERLALFVPVCEAVQHAHQKGIVHRDIKPSNVLVAAYDGRPIPKVIDFGIAKAMGQKLTERTLVTNLGGIIGTLEYMSPEQAEFNSLDIDTRADIYSLGVLLYELLTGTTPLTKQRLKDAAITEALRLIREEEPPTPSTRLCDSKKTLASTSAQRKLEPARLTKEVRGEIDWIVMKCLEKNRTRRYETANGLARDIQRYLTDEPVEAGPPSASYKLRKFARKHRKLLWTTGAFVFLLVGAVMSLSVALVAVNRERQEKEAALQAEGKRRKQARAALHAMSSQIIEDWLAKQTVLLPEHKQFLEQALRHYEEFAADTGQQEEARSGVAEASSRVGVIRYLLGQLKESENAWEHSRDLYDGLVADFPGVPTYRHELAEVNYKLGMLYRQAGRVGDAEGALSQGLGIHRNLAANFPTVLTYRQGEAKAFNNLGLLFETTRRTQEAEVAYGQALTILKQLVADFPNTPACLLELSQTYVGLGSLLDNAGRAPEAVEPYERAVAIVERLIADFPGGPDYRYSVARVRNALGRVLRASGRNHEAEAVFRHTLAIQKQVVADFPAVPSYRQDLAMPLNNWGALLKNTNRAREAEEVYREAMKIQKQLTGDFPAVPAYHNETAGAMVNLARMYLSRKEIPGARQLLEEAVPYHKTALKANPHHPDYRRYYRNNRWRMAEKLLELKDHEAAAAATGEFLQATAEPARDAYTAACLLAECVKLAAQDERLTESQRHALTQTYGNSALAALRQAIDKGASEISLMKTDPGLDPLRSREDFQRLLAKTEATHEP